MMRLLWKRHDRLSPRDRGGVKALQKAGVDLSQPQEFVHRLYFDPHDGRERADDAASRLRAAGYAVSVEASQSVALMVRATKRGRDIDTKSRTSFGTWEVRAIKVAIPEPATIREMTAEIERIAKDSCGLYWGWDAAGINTTKRGEIQPPQGPFD